MINFYALDYMYADAHYDKFMALLSLFGLAINCLALTNNLGALYFTWELVGICSYLLVVYWKERQHSLKSGFKPILYNKLGDIAYLYSASLVVTRQVSNGLVGLNWVLWLRTMNYKFIVKDSNYWSLIIASLTASDCPSPSWHGLHRSKLKRSRRRWTSTWIIRL